MWGQEAYPVANKSEYIREGYALRKYGGPQLSHQIQIAHIKYKLLTSNTNYSHQIQIAHIKNKIKLSAVGERKLCPVFTRP